eukprot:459988-Pleurochrysis_carterae.AAC.1
MIFSHSKILDLTSSRSLLHVQTLRNMLVDVDAYAHHCALALALLVQYLDIGVGAQYPATAYKV